MMARHWTAPANEVAFSRRRADERSEARRPALKRALNKPENELQADLGDFVQGSGATERLLGLEASGIRCSGQWC
jgi:hypothetical protein